MNLAPLTAALQASTVDAPTLDELPDIPEAAREIILDRLEAGFAEGYYNLSPRDYEGLLLSLLPEDFTILVNDLPNNDPPGSPGRVDAYRRRACGGQLFITGDVNPVAADITGKSSSKRTVHGLKRGNGTGGRSLGWVSTVDTHDEPLIEPGLYRDASGVWFDVEEEIPKPKKKKPATPE